MNHAEWSLNLYDEAGIPMNRSYKALVVEHEGTKEWLLVKRL